MVFEFFGGLEGLADRFINCLHCRLRSKERMLLCFIFDAVANKVVCITVDEAFVELVLSLLLQFVLSLGLLLGGTELLTLVDVLL